MYDNMLIKLQKLYKLTMILQCALEEVRYGKKE